MKDIEGIVISEKPYSETSKLVRILTTEGIIDLLAKGARTLKSDLRVSTTKMTYGIFHMHYKENKLSTLNSVDIIDNFKNIKKDINKISYIMELAVDVIKQNINPNIFKILISSLKKIDEGEDIELITNILEIKYLEYLGVMPVIDGCAVCGSKTSIATISSTRGGYICNNCLTNEKIVDKKTIKLLRMLYYVNIDSIESINISNKIKKELNDFIDEYYDFYTGLYLKSKAFLKNLNRIK